MLDLKILRVLSSLSLLTEKLATLLTLDEALEISARD